jgi:hypothetical protein
LPKRIQIANCFRFGHKKAGFPVQIEDHSLFLFALGFKKRTASILRKKRALSLRKIEAVREKCLAAGAKSARPPFPVRKVAYFYAKSKQFAKSTLRRTENANCSDFPQVIACGV